MYCSWFKALRTKGDIVRGDAVVLGVARAEILAPVDLVDLGSLAIEQRDENIVTGFRTPLT